MSNPKGVTPLGLFGEKMRLNEMTLTHRNPDASADLIIPVKLKCPVSYEQMIEFAKTNMQAECEWVNVVPPHDGVAIVCGNAPSLLNTWEQVAAYVENGADIFACNSAAKFFNDRGIKPKYQVLLDSLDIVKTQVGDAHCHLMASIVHPDVFSMADNPILWHPAMGELAGILNDSAKSFAYIGGGITCGNSALCLAHTLGYREIHVHGMDSSMDADAFHAHPEETDKDLHYIEVEENGKVYKTAYDYKQQVVVFLKLAELILQEGTNLRVFGTGLLPDMFNSQLLEETKNACV